MKTEYANPCLSITFPFFPFFPFKRKGSVFFRAARVGQAGACGRGVGMCGWVGTKRKKRKNGKVIDTQRFGVSVSFPFSVPFSVPFGGVIGGGFCAMGLCGMVYAVRVP